MKQKFIAVAAAFIFGLSACTSDGPKQSAGTFVGAATGALVGSQFGKGHGRMAGIAIGTLIGSQLGSHIGAKMDQKDRELANQTAFRALEKQPDHAVSSWKNPNTSHSGNFVVTNTTEDGSRVCRSYAHTVFIDGEQEVVKGRACRQPDGTWQHVG